MGMAQAHPANVINQTYFKMSGTSVSAPMVSGAVAILLQSEPNLTPDQVKYRLMSTANKSWTGYVSKKSRVRLSGCVCGCEDKDNCIVKHKYPSQSIAYNRIGTDHLGKYWVELSRLEYRWLEHGRLEYCWLEYGRLEYSRMEHRLLGSIRHSIKELIMNPTIHISGIILLTITLSLAVFIAVYVLQHIQLLKPLSTVSWNR